MFNQTVWHGTAGESSALVKAIAGNCACAFGLMGVRLSVCGPHRMLVEDQRVLDGLLFARRMADSRRRAEFSTSRSAPADS